MASLRKDQLPTHEDMVARITAVYEAATKEDVVEGTEWYGDAEAFAAALASGTEHSVETIAAVISAISPRMPWGRNKSVAAEIVDRHTWARDQYAEYGGLGIGRNVNLAVDILTGIVDPWEVFRDKRLAFWRNICGDREHVTVDTWAVKIATGLKVDGPGSSYSAVAAAYSDAAELIGISPRELQAITWVTYRRDTVTEQTLIRLDRS